MSGLSTSLPRSDDLDISVLSRLFKDTTNSYKYVFFISLLDIMKRRQFSCEPIDCGELIVEMLANSWYPYIYFKLSFGPQDKITAQLDLISLQIGEYKLKFDYSGKTMLRDVISKQDLSDSLLRYVPFRLLRPFFEKELGGAKDHEVNQKIKRLAEELFDQRIPLYRIGYESEQIIIHEAWTTYLKKHHSIVRGWVSWKWLEYMQRCNPNVPAVASKLFPPHKRDSMANQIKHWKEILKHGSCECIYSGVRLKDSSISLDHYLPWTFVAHDQLWNLVPTLAYINSAKSDRLPANAYFAPFVKLQHRGLVVSQQILSERRWEKRVESFIADLKLSDKRDLLDYEKLNRAYQQTVLPLLELAKGLGFSHNWRYRVSDFDTLTKEQTHI